VRASDVSAARRLLSASAVRERAQDMLRVAASDGLSHFTLHLDRLPEAARLVSATIRDQYPALDIPFHARWRHFKADGQDLWQSAKGLPTDARARGRAAFDLAIVSVLLDAGAGMGWRYRDEPTGAVMSRSEGLAVASLRMMEAGAFSARRDEPWRADAARLAALRADDIASGFQVSETNPLIGAQGRADLLARLGRIVAADPVFALADDPRPGGLFDLLAGRADKGRLKATLILDAVLTHLGPIWPSRLTLAGVPLGDCWRHPAIRRAGPTNGLIPFHKLSQWLSYSLIEPLQAAGLDVIEIDGMTGLPEYRNGGLFLDSGVVSLKDEADRAKAHAVDSALVVEWRGLTVALLDRIAPLVRAELGLTKDDFPLAKVLEGGTWATGRRLAAKLRADGGPPLQVISDGTVF
jgi:hypothetical protein